MPIIKFTLNIRLVRRKANPNGEYNIFKLKASSMLRLFNYGSTKRNTNPIKSNLENKKKKMFF